METSNNTGISPYRSLRNRLLALMGGMTLIALVAYTFLAYDATRDLQQMAQNASSLTLRQQAQQYMIALNLQMVRENDLILNQVSQNTMQIADTIGAIYRNRELYNRTSFWNVDDHMRRLSDGQYGNPGTDVSSVFVPATTGLNPDSRLDLRLTAYLDLVLPAVYQNSPNAEAVYFGTKHDVVRYYPNIDLASVVPADFAVTQRPWYTGSVENVLPQGKAWWTPVYEDATGLGWVTTAAMPVYDHQRQLVGVVGFDISLNDMKARIEQMNILGSGYAFLLDPTGRAIAIPARGYQELLGREPLAGEVGTELNEARLDFLPLIEEMKIGRTGFMTIQSQEVGEVFAAYAPLETTGWSMASVVSTDIVLAEVRKMEGEMNAATQRLVVSRLIPLTLALIAVLVVIGLIMTSRLVNPIAHLAEAAKQIGAGHWDAELPKTSPDEIGMLANSFMQMRTQLRDLVNELENRVLERTGELEKRSEQVLAVSEIARDIAGARSLDEMLNNAIEMAVTRFDFYYGGIFLLDEMGEYAHQVAVAGHMSDLFRQRRVKLRVGLEGIVGYVASQGRARTSSDVSLDENYYYDAMLAGTRAEIALPLKIGERVIGVLDMQRTQAGAFAPEDINVLQTMADQLAIAIENRRLVQRLESAVQESGALYQKQLEKSWSEASNRMTAPGFVYDGLEVHNIDMGVSEQIQNELAAGQTITVIKERDGALLSVIATPIMLRGQAIGALVLEHHDSQHKWTADEIAILEATANQAALTLENARLLEESQWRAQREQMISQMTTRIRETLDIHTVMRTAVEELRHSLLLPELTIHLGTIDPGLKPAKAGNDNGKNGKSTNPSQGDPVDSDQG